MSYNNSHTQSIDTNNVYLSKIEGIEVRYVEVDKMGAAHHSSYWAWLEVARIKWLQQRKIQYTQLEKIGIFLPLVRATIKYINPLHFGDIITIYVSVERNRISCIDFDYKIYNQKMILTTTATTQLSLLDNNRQIKTFLKLAKDIMPPFIKSKK